LSSARQILTDRSRSLTTLDVSASALLCQSPGVRFSESQGATSHRKKLEKAQDTLHKQQAELQAFDEKLQHCADMRISLDLDDGVKVNCGKFGDLLAEVKAVCGEE